MSLQDRLMQRRETQHTQQHVAPTRAEPQQAIKQEQVREEVKFKGQAFDQNSLAEDRLYETQWNDFRQANGRYPVGNELDKFAAEQKQAPQQKPQVNDQTFDKAISVNIDREQRGKQSLAMPPLMDALDRVAKQRLDEAMKIDMTPELKVQRLTK